MTTFDADMIRKIDFQSKYTYIKSSITIKKNRAVSSDWPDAKTSNYPLVEEVGRNLKNMWQGLALPPSGKHIFIFFDSQLSESL